MKIATAFLFALAVTVCLSVPALTRSELYGNAASSDQAQRVIALNRPVREIRVHTGEIVKLADGGKSVTWHFDGRAHSFLLSKLWPVPGAASVRVRVLRASA